MWGNLKQNKYDDESKTMDFANPEPQGIQVFSATAFLVKPDKHCV